MTMDLYESYIIYLHREKGYPFDELRNMPFDNLKSLYYRIKDYKEKLINMICRVTREYVDDELFSKILSMSVNELETLLNNGCQLDADKDIKEGIANFFESEDSEDFEYLEPDEYASAYGVEDMTSSAKNGIFVMGDVKAFSDEKLRDLKKRMIKVILAYYKKNNIKQGYTLETLKLKTFGEVRVIYERLSLIEKSIVPYDELEKEAVFGFKKCS